MDPTRPIALSLKQPWAALITAGLKTIEVRRWPTSVRGLVYIHASRAPDDRPEAWIAVPDEIRPLTETLGGIIGLAELTNCQRFLDQDDFLEQREQHFNDPDWWNPPMYALHIARAREVPFFPCSGNVKFFTPETIVPPIVVLPPEGTE